MKVLIVDDEQMICEWLQFCIGQNPACTLAGVAHNGREALTLYRDTDPDLILTDIKMPVMDGLELLHALRSSGCTAMIVILTAFAEFDMAREALREGADEYLIKTEMQNETLQALLNRAAHTCSMQTNVPSGETAQAYAIIRNLLRKEGDLTAENLEELRQCGIQWKDNGLFAMAVWKHRILGSGLAFPQEEKVRQVTGFDYSDRIYVTVGNLYRAVSSTEKSAALLRYAKEFQKSNGCMVGISGITDNMQRVPAMVKQAAFSLAQGFYSGDNRLFEPQMPLEKLVLRAKEWKGSVQPLCAKLYQQSPEEQLVSVEAFLRDTAQKRIADVDMVMKVFMDLFELFLSKAKTMVIDVPQSDEQRKRLSQCLSMADGTEIVLHTAGQCTAPLQARKPRSKAVMLAVDYIRSNYAGQISLEQVASEVYLNPEYFSRVFREEVGVTFVNYLTELRLTRSVQLLEDTAMRVQDIARDVGYTNVSYFSTTFKKRFGTSPYEYRRNSVSGK